MSEGEIELQADFFPLIKVKELGPDDFWIGSKTPIALRDRGCNIILFYSPSDPASIAMKGIWARLARDLAGVKFMAVNTSTRETVMEAFKKVNLDADNPVKDYAIRGIPSIIVYRNGWPQAYYNGELSYDAIKKWAIVLACEPGYKEPDEFFQGTAAIVPDEFVIDTRQEDFDFPVDSRAFTSDIGEGRGRAFAEEAQFEAPGGEFQVGSVQDLDQSLQDLAEQQASGYGGYGFDGEGVSF